MCERRMREIYARGMIAGITAHAYWEDGVQYVGTGRKPLKKAVEEINALDETSAGYMADTMNYDLYNLREVQDDIVK